MTDYAVFSCLTLLCKISCKNLHALLKCQKSQGERVLFMFAMLPVHITCKTCSDISYSGGSWKEW